MWRMNMEFSERVPLSEQRLIRKRNGEREEEEVAVAVARMMTMTMRIRMQDSGRTCVMIDLIDVRMHVCMHVMKGEIWFK